MLPAASDAATKKTPIYLTKKNCTISSPNTAHIFTIYDLAPQGAHSIYFHLHLWEKAVYDQSVRNVAKISRKIASRNVLH